MAGKNRARLLAIPPETASDEMTTLVRVGTGLHLQGEGGTEYFCGRCGRLLLFGVEPHSVLDVWFKCPKCLWLNGLDISLGWAKYVINELEARKLSIERIEQLLDELQTFDGPVEAFVERNNDVGPALAWLGKIGIGTIVAILTLLYMVYAQPQNLGAAKEGLDIAKQQLTLGQKRLVPGSLPRQQILEIARELRRLQGELQLKPPPPPPSSRGRVGRRKR